MIECARLVQVLNHHVDASNASAGGASSRRRRRTADLVDLARPVTLGPSLGSLPLEIHEEIAARLDGSSLVKFRAAGAAAPVREIAARHVRTVELGNLAHLPFAARAFPQTTAVSFVHCADLAHRPRRRLRPLRRFTRIGSVAIHPAPNGRPVGGGAINASVIETILAAAPNITSLDLLDVHDMAPGALAPLTRPGNLGLLALPESPIGRNELAAIVAAHPNLKRVRLRQAFETVSPDDLQPLGKLTNLRELDLSWTLCNDALLHRIIVNNPLLERLALNGCPMPDRDALREIADLRHLTELEVAETDIAGETLTAIAERNPSLRRIRIADCASVDNATIERLRGLLPACAIDTRSTRPQAG